DAARRLEAAGATVVPMQPFLAREMLSGMDHAWRMRSHLEMKALPPARKAKVLPFIQAWADSAAGMGGEDVFRATQQFHATRVATVAATNPFDYLISPVAPGPAFSADWAMPVNDPLRSLEHIAFTVPFNMSEQPASSVNCGYTAAGLP